jgi:uncharacterized membrane protein HdeD (DUF308 family)
MKRENSELGAPAIVAGLLLLLGLGLLIWPDVVLGVFPPLIGGVLVLVGGLMLAQCIVIWQYLAQPELRVLNASVNIVIGLVFIIKHDVSLAFLSILFGIYVLIMAGIDFSSALGAMWSGEAWIGLMLEALVKLVLGALLMFAPFSGRSLWAQVLGGYFVVAAVRILFWLCKA